jgi:hypothetical protein
MEAKTQGGNPLAERKRNGRRLALCAVLLVVFWSLLEIPLELAATTGAGAAAALLCSKGLIVVIGFGTILGARWAGRVFVFICVMSLLAVVPTLFLELRTSPVDFYFSFVECILKALALAALACCRSGEAHRQ